MLLLPGQPGFNEILQSTFPPGWQQECYSSGIPIFVVDPGGIMRHASLKELHQYWDDGIYAARMQEIDSQEQTSEVNRNG